MLYAITALIITILSIIFDFVIVIQTIEGSIKPEQGKALVLIAGIISAIAILILAALAIITSI